MEHECAIINVPPNEPLKLRGNMTDRIAELRALRSDAERYRWLRKHFRFANDSMRELWFDASLQPENELAPVELDRSIDREMEGLRDD